MIERITPVSYTHLDVYKRQVVEIPFTQIATDVATAKSANMVALGAVVKTLDIITLDDAKEVIKMKMKPALVEANIKALEAGYDYVK